MGNQDTSNTIKVKISSIVNSGMGCWLYTHYVQFPHSTYRYDIQASLEGFMYTTKLWKKAGMEVVFEDKYPK